MSHHDEHDAGAEPLLGIGEVARASGLTPKALRLYDELGLLAPAEVDAVTGYRRYAREQLEQARLVARLRRAGLPLARIRGVVAMTPAAAAAELTSYWRQVEADTATARALVSDLVASLRHEETTMDDHTTLTHRSAVGTRIGQGAREQQLDALLTGAGLHAVADGFGTTAGVAEAALAALAPWEPGPDPLAALDAAVARAAEAVDARAATGDDGCTLTMLATHGEHLLVGHVGDSRAHRVREGRLERLTRDHTLVQTLVDEGRLSPEEALTDERRVQLNRALAAGAPHQPDLAVHRVRPGDRYVLTTDGVHGRVDAATLASLLVDGRSPDEVAGEVAAAVEAAGADDNYAVVVVDLGS